MESSPGLIIWFEWSTKVERKQSESGHRAWIGPIRGAAGVTSVATKIGQCLGKRELQDL